MSDMVHIRLLTGFTVAVPAVEQFGDFAVHAKADASPSHKGWVITHAPTGVAVWRSFTLEAARTICVYCSEHLRSIPPQVGAKGLHEWWLALPAVQRGAIHSAFLGLEEM